MSTRHTCSLRLRAVLALIVALAPARGSAQDPVNKPTAERSPLTRLPAPTSVTARQLADGRIEVRWDAMDGAVKYDLWRSVPPFPQTMPVRFESCRDHLHRCGRKEGEHLLLCRRGGHERRHQWAEGRFCPRDRNDRAGIAQPPHE